jgi:hypothetical protein
LSITGFNINGEIKRYDYESLDNQPDIPTKNSQLENDTEYVEKTELTEMGYATENYVKNAIAEAELSGSDEPIDLSGYATKDDIKNFITEIPEEYVTESELNNKGYLTEHQDISHLASKNEIPTKTSQLTNDSGYLTEHQSLEDYAKKTDIPDVSGFALKSDVPSVEGLASEVYVDTKVNIFHASIDNSNFQYVKGSADFTYEQAVNTENCQIEVKIANETMYLKKQEHKNINPPDSIAGRYVGFSEMIRTAGEYAEVFLFVYDPENLPTDEVSVDRLKDWGDYQYCVSSYQPVMMGNFLGKDISAERNKDNLAPSMKSSGDYTDKQCGVVLDYMQTTFADNIMNLVADTYGPHVVYKDGTGFEASNSDVGKIWHLTGLDLTPYKRLKFYVRSAGDGNDNFTPSHIVEMHLSGNAKSYKEEFVAGHMSQNPNNGNRIHCVTFAVNAEKTAVQFVRATSLYGTASTNSSGGRVCYLIEGYKV